MKSKSLRNRLREKFRRGQTAYGLWVTLESPNITEAAAALGLDWVCMEMEHGHLDFREILEHTRAVRGSNTSVLVRVPEIQQGVIKRILDLGAHGILVPLVRNHHDVERAFQFARYPMRGVRGVGGERAVKWGLGMKEYLACANEEILVIPMIETRDSVENIDAILQAEGVEAIFFGPADLSASHGYLGDWEGPGIARQILNVQKKAAAKGIAAGISTQSISESIKRRDQGFGMVGLSSDMSLLLRSLRENLERLGCSAKPRLWF